MSVSVVSPVFIGRHGEMASLAVLRGQAQAREPAFALVGGEAGVGKTRLVREFSAQAAEAGFLVLTGQCVELGAEGLPLAPLVDALRTLTRSLPPETLDGVFGATLRLLRAELCALRGRYEDAARELRDARRAVGASNDVQFTQPMRYVDALIALGRGDLPAAREAVAAGLTGAPLSWDARYSWPLLWIGMRAAAEEATWFRDRREQVPADLTRRCAELAAAAEHLATPAPPWLGFRALVAAEQARASGAAETQAWMAAVAAWHDTGEPYLLAYALLRLAEVHSQANDRQEAARAVQRAHAIADRLGAAPIAEQAAALARRARLSLDAGHGHRGGARRAATAGRTRQVRAHRARARGADPARGRPVQPRDRPGPVHQQ